MIKVIFAVVLELLVHNSLFSLNNFKIVICTLERINFKVNVKGLDLNALKRYQKVNNASFYDDLIKHAEDLSPNFYFPPSFFCCFCIENKHEHLAQLKHIKLYA